MLIKSQLNTSSASSYLGSRLNPIWMFTSSTTWTAPFDGMYRIVCVGKGEDGGNGVSHAQSMNTSSDTREWIAILGPSSGAGGGVAISNYKLQANDVLTLSITLISSTVNTDELVATAGENGYNGQSEICGRKNPHTLVVPAIPKGGRASGTLMTTGWDGEDGLSHRIVEYGSKKKIDMFRGGNVGCIITYPMINGTGGIGAFPSQVINGTNAYGFLSRTQNLDTSNLPDTDNESMSTTIPGGGNAGGGGACGASFCHVENTNVSWYSYIKQGIGGKGGPGAILIEYLGQ